MIPAFFVFGGAIKHFGPLWPVLAIIDIISIHNVIHRPGSLGMADILELPPVIGCHTFRPLWSYLPPSDRFETGIVELRHNIIGNACIISLRIVIAHPCL